MIFYSKVYCGLSVVIRKHYTVNSVDNILYCKCKRNTVSVYMLFA